MRKFVIAAALLVSAAALGVLAGAITWLFTSWIAGLLVGLIIWAGASLLGLALLARATYKEAQKLINEVQQDFDNDDPFSSLQWKRPDASSPHGPIVEPTSLRFGQYGSQLHPTPYDYFYGKLRPPK